jgi:hypothetical protein
VGILRDGVEWRRGNTLNGAIHDLCENIPNVVILVKKGIIKSSNRQIDDGLLLNYWYIVWQEEMIMGIG